MTDRLTQSSRSLASLRFIRAIPRDPTSAAFAALERALRTDSAVQLAAAGRLMLRPLTSPPFFYWLSQIRLLIE
jgi:hypothetical protein